MLGPCSRHARWFEFAGFRKQNVHVWQTPDQERTNQNARIHQNYINHTYIVYKIINVLFVPFTSAPQPKEYEGRVLYRISFLWYSAVCFAVTYITGLLVSVLWPGMTCCLSL